MASTPATCGNPNGDVNINVFGGVAGYQYLWSNGAITKNIHGVLASNYTVTVTDSKGCTQVNSASVSNVGGPTLTKTSVNELCNGGSTGSINLNVNGGVLPYAYNWGNGLLLKISIIFQRAPTW